MRRLRSLSITSFSFLVSRSRCSRPDCTKGKIKHGKNAVILVNDQRSATLKDNRTSGKEKGSQFARMCGKTSCNRILARFLLVTSPTKGLNVLKIPFCAVIPYLRTDRIHRLWIRLMRIAKAGFPLPGGSPSNSWVRPGAS